jgi:hypothetical protein
MAVLSCCQLWTGHILRIYALLQPSNRFLLMGARSHFSPLRVSLAINVPRKLPVGPQPFSTFTFFFFFFVWIFSLWLCWHSKETLQLLAWFFSDFFTTPIYLAICICCHVYRAQKSFFYQFSSRVQTFTRFLNPFFLTTNRYFFY